VELRQFPYRNTLQRAEATLASDDDAEDINGAPSVIITVSERNGSKGK